MKDKIDYKILTALTLEINDRIKLINTTFPKDKEILLKHLAAASIHLALFMKGIYTDKEGLHPESEDYLEDFLNNCGCNYERMD